MDPASSSPSHEPPTQRHDELMLGNTVEPNKPEKDRLTEPQTSLDVQEVKEREQPMRTAHAAHAVHSGPYPGRLAPWRSSSSSFLHRQTKEEEENWTTVVNRKKRPKSDDERHLRLEKLGKRSNLHASARFSTGFPGSD